MSLALHSFALHANEKSGNLVAIQDTDLGFSIKRVFFISNVTDAMATRGHHGHRNTNQFLICIKGSCHVTVNNEESFPLTDPTKGLFLPRNHVVVMSDFTPDALLLVLCDQYFEDDQVFPEGAAVAATPAQETTPTEIPSSVASDVQIAASATVYGPSNLYGCSIGENVMVGPFVEIQKGVTVGENTRIQSHSLVCEGVEIGKDCFIGHGVMFTNDLLRGTANQQPHEYLPTIVEDNVQIGSNATILPVRIGAHAVIGAGSTVTKDVPAHSVVKGVR